MDVVVVVQRVQSALRRPKVGQRLCQLGVSPGGAGPTPERHPNTGGGKKGKDALGHDGLRRIGHDRQLVARSAPGADVALGVIVARTRLHGRPADAAADQARQQSFRRCSEAGGSLGG